MGGFHIHALLSTDLANFCYCHFFFICYMMQWRKFNFFNLKSNADQGKLSEAIKVSLIDEHSEYIGAIKITSLLLLLQEADITCSTNGNNQIIICDSYGCVHLFDRSWAVSTFKGHTGPIHLCELSHQHNLLITIGVCIHIKICSNQVSHYSKLYRFCMQFESLSERNYWHSTSIQNMESV